VDVLSLRREDHFALGIPGEAQRYAGVARVSLEVRGYGRVQLVLQPAGGDVAVAGGLGEVETRELLRLMGERQHRGATRGERELDTGLALGPWDYRHRDTLDEIDRMGQRPWGGIVVHVDGERHGRPLAGWVVGHEVELRRPEALQDDAGVTGRGLRHRLPAGEGQALDQRSVVDEDRSVPVVPVRALPEVVVEARVCVAEDHEQAGLGCVGKAGVHVVDEVGRQVPVEPLLEAGLVQQHQGLSVHERPRVGEVAGAHGRGLDRWLLF